MSGPKPETILSTFELETRIDINAKTSSAITVKPSDDQTAAFDLDSSRVITIPKVFNFESINRSNIAILKIKTILC